MRLPREGGGPKRVVVVRVAVVVSFGGWRIVVTPFEVESETAVLAESEDRGRLSSR